MVLWSLPSSHMANISQEWFLILQTWHLDLFFIPACLLTLTTLLLSPALLACVLLTPALRNETRFLLLANTLAADLLFLTLNLLIVACNAAGVAMPRLACELAAAVKVTAYCCAILTVTLMVADTYAAVRWPLRYHHLLPAARARRIVAGVWALAAVYPLSLVAVMEAMASDDLDRRPAVCLVLVSLGAIGGRVTTGLNAYYCVGAALCALLVLYCYGRLYAVTRTQGIWRSRYSRARVTLLAHGVLLILYFGPGLVFTVELFLFDSRRVSAEAHVWANTVNMCVLMLLPRAAAPCVYGLRYREVTHALLAIFNPHRRLSQVTVS